MSIAHQQITRLTKFYLTVLMAKKAVPVQRPTLKAQCDEKAETS